MSFGSFNQEQQTPIADINTTPLVDVMLVLLVVLIITTPLLTNAVHVALPTVSSSEQQRQPTAIQLTLNAKGAIFWDSQWIEEHEVPIRLAQAVHHNPDVIIYLWIDNSIPYANVAALLSTAQQAGIHQIGIMTKAMN